MLPAAKPPPTPSSANWHAPFRLSLDLLIVKSSDAHHIRVHYHVPLQEEAYGTWKKYLARGCLLRRYRPAWSAPNRRTKQPSLLRLNRPISPSADCALGKSGTRHRAGTQAPLCTGVALP